jgi:predicted TIM-barrel fold metal-dependent hydrolase
MHRREFVASAAWSWACTTLSFDGFKGPARARLPALAPPSFNAHAHLMSAGLADRLRQRTGEARFQLKDARWLLEEMDRAGIKRALVLSGAYLQSTDVRGDADSTAAGRADEYRRVREENDFVAAQAAQAPDRLISFGSVNPKRPYAIEEIDRCTDRLGMRGLKVHLWASDVRMSDEAHVEGLLSAFNRVAAKGMPVVAHVFNNKASVSHAEAVKVFISRVVQQTPRLRVSIAHLTGPGGYDSDVAAGFSALTDVVNPSDDLKARVWVDCSAVLFATGSQGLPPTSAMQRDRLGPQLTRWGLDRVLWGSDNVPTALSDIEAAWPLSADEWAIIAKNDGQRFLGS